MKALIQDLRYALRMLWKSPGFSLVAIISLALGIGLNTSIFSIVNVVLIRPVPIIREQHRLVWLRAPISYPDYADYRAQTHSFEGMAAVTGTSEFSLARDGEPELIKGEYVTENYFDVLGVSAFKGRTFDKAEGQTPTPVVVLSEHLWRTRFNSDVTIRTREIGIRMALGAKQKNVLRLVLGEGLFVITVGLAVGLLLAFAVTRVIAGFLYGVGATDPVTFSVVPLLLGLRVAYRFLHTGAASNESRSAGGASI